ncbi:MAG: hypothetical protein DSM106950_13405 [Stigonema ocellatum SAG 48.90 = DSM 106950]|nr:hypothetical protein [Stigonema ocellatum SAG 48.90 = DSM 106950]
MTLLEQPYIKDQSITVADLIERNSVALGENIEIYRFVRFTLDSDSSPPGENPNAGRPQAPLPDDPDPLDAAALER